MHIIAFLPQSASDVDIVDTREICEGCYLAAYGINAQALVDINKTLRNLTLSALVDTTDRPESGEFIDTLHERLVEKFGSRFNVEVKPYRASGPVLAHRAKLPAA